MLKGMLEGCILQVISMEETYGYEISRKLNLYGFGEISEGTIYPLLLRLQKNGLISSVMKASENGPNRKYFYLTEKGRIELELFKDNCKELFCAINQLFENDIKE